MDPSGDIEESIQMLEHLIWLCRQARSVAFSSVSFGQAEMLAASLNISQALAFNSQIQHRL